MFVHDTYHKLVCVHVIWDLHASKIRRIYNICHPCFVSASNPPILEHVSLASWNNWPRASYNLHGTQSSWFKVRVHGDPAKLVSSSFCLQKVLSEVESGVSIVTASVWSVVRMGQHSNCVMTSTMNIMYTRTIPLLVDILAPTKLAVPSLRLRRGFWCWSRVIHCVWKFLETWHVDWQKCDKTSIVPWHLTSTSYTSEPRCY